MEGVTGTLFEVHNSTELAEALRRYLVHARLRRQHGENARQRALRDFVPADMWRCLLGEYQQMLQTHTCLGGG